MLSHVPASSMAEVAEDMKAIFKVRRIKVRREKTAKALAEAVVRGALRQAVAEGHLGV